uniref:Major facilitator superfamily (MFS) profile domain-containing protein n=2 Tax=Mucochytrium quahogii TaxID=96639 RepID=A0A7S2SIM4_9STRA|mmetsp:Transcript_26888/g.43285  ORF Transcript_26888/g.43285 Transcript_26888/m.43285 type:complete len:361 (+) Transcript_26888:1258-2340(+)
MLSSIIGCIGSILYGLALVFNSPATLFICRVLIGLSGSINLFLEYYAVTIGKKKLKENINTIWAIGTLGLGFGPIASASIGYIFGDLLGLYPQNNKLFNTVTIPGWFMACLYLTQAVIFCFAFKAPTKHEHAVYRELQRKQMPSDNKSVAPISMIDVVVLGALLFCIFAAGVGVGGIETRTAFVAQAQNEDHTSDAIAWSWNTNWTGLYLGLFFTIFAVGSYLYGKILKKARVSNRCWLMLNVSALVVSCIMFFDFSGIFPSGSIALWSVGFLIFGLAAANYRGDAIAMALHRCPNHWVSTYSAMITLCSSLGRATGPMGATYIGSGYMHQSVFASLLIGIFGAAALLMGVLYKQLDPSR